jgi:hypothetical protein
MPACTQSLIRIEEKMTMLSFVRTIAIVAGCLAATGAAAQVDEEMNRILDEAMPYMHHSCESVMNNYGDDEEKIAESVRLMVAVSLFNREIDIEKQIPDEAERASLKDEFVEALEEACEADPDALLAGAVDTAVKDAVY